MPVSHNNPSVGNNVIGVFRIQEGGHGKRTPLEGLVALGGIPNSMIGQANGPIPLDATGDIPAIYFGDMSFTTVSVEGNRQILCDQEARFKISNFDSYINYDIEASVGSVRLDPAEGVIYYRAPIQEGPCGFTISGREIELQAIEGGIETPSIISPTVQVDEQFYFDSEEITFTASPFSTTDNTGSIIEIFRSADWEISTSEHGFEDASGLYRVNHGSLSTSWTATGLVDKLQMWVRVRYNGIERSSDWSTPIKVTNAEFQIKTPEIITPSWGSSGVGFLDTVSVTDGTKASVILTGDAFEPMYFQDTHVSSDWEVATDIDFTNIVSSSLADTENKESIQVNGLNFEAIYYARVRYNGAVHVSEWSNYTFFYVAADMKVINKPLIESWEHQSGTGALSQLFRVNATPYTTNGYTVPFTESRWWVAETGAPYGSYVTSPNNKLSLTLEIGKSYKAMVSYVDAVRMSEVSDEFVFTVIDDRVVLTPTVLAPENNSTDHISTPTFVTTAFNFNSDLLGYTESHVSSDWQIARNSDFSVIEVNDQGNASSLTTKTLASPLLFETDYYLRVRHRGTIKLSDWSPVVKFTTMVDNRSIEPPVIALTNGSVGSAPRTPTFSSSDAVFLNFTGNLTSVKWEIANDAEFTSLVVSQTKTTAMQSFAPAVTLAYTTSYYVRVTYYSNDVTPVSTVLNIAVQDNPAISYKPRILQAGAYYHENVDVGIGSATYVGLFLSQYEINTAAYYGLIVQFSTNNFASVNGSMVFAEGSGYAQTFSLPGGPDWNTSNITRSVNPGSTQVIPYKTDAIKDASDNDGTTCSHLKLIHTSFGGAADMFTAAGQYVRVKYAIGGQETKWSDAVYVPYFEVNVNDDEDPSIFVNKPSITSATYSQALLVATRPARYTLNASAFGYTRDQAAISLNLTRSFKKTVFKVYSNAACTVEFATIDAGAINSASVDLEFSTTYYVRVYQESNEGFSSNLSSIYTLTTIADPRVINTPTLWYTYLLSYDTANGEGVIKTYNVQCSAFSSNYGATLYRYEWQVSSNKGVYTVLTYNSETWLHQNDPGGRINNAVRVRHISNDGRTSGWSAWINLVPTY